MSLIVGDYTSSEQIKNAIKKRMGICPSFFLLAEHSPEVMGQLWHHTQAAYLDNPLPSIFKEKLFAYVSRYCSSPYCMARHSAFLAGRGRIAGDEDAMAIDAEEVVTLLARPLLLPNKLQHCLLELEEFTVPISGIPFGSRLEYLLIECSAVLFVHEFTRHGPGYPETSIKSSREMLNRLLGNGGYQNLIVFLSFIRTAHSWTKLHAGLQLEDDVVELLLENSALARFVDLYSELLENETTELGQQQLEEVRRANENLQMKIAEQIEYAEKTESAYLEIVKDIKGVVWKSEIDAPRYLFVSDNVEAVLGFPVKRWVDESDLWAGQIVDEDRKQTLEFHRTQTRKGLDHQIIYRFRRADGEVIWISDLVRIVRDSNGVVTHSQGIMVDITAQKNAERDARESESRMRIMFESGPDCVKVLDSRNRLLDMNQAGLAMIDAPSLDVVAGHSVLPMILPEYRDAFLAAGKRVFKGEHAFLEFEMKGLQGRQLCVESYISPIRNDDGAIVAQIGVTRNITEKNRFQQQLQAQVDMTHELLDTTLDGYILVDSRGNLQEVNQAYCEFVGYRRDKLLSMNIGELDVAMNPEAIRDKTEQLITDGRGRFETRHQHRDGHLIDLDVSVVVLNRESPEPAFATFVRDVSRQKKFQTALMESESRFRAMFEQAAVGVAQIETKTGRFLQVNRRYAEITGYSVDELKATDFRVITHPDDLQENLDKLELLRTGKIREYSIEKRYFCKNGTIVWVALTVSPLWEVGVEPEFHIAVVEDISSRVSAMNALQANKAKLRELNLDLEKRIFERTAELVDKNQELEGFAHSISHDLRAPLRAMEGFANALSEDCSRQLDATGHEYIKYIRDSARYMDGMVNDLLAYSRLGRDELNLENVELDVVVRKATDQFRSEISQRQAGFDVSDQLQAVIGHRSTLVQIVANLLGNALKFVPAGKRPQIKIWSELRDNQQLRLWVEDNGIGISPEYQKKIFNVFERLHGIESYPGTGIGLAIVARGCERLRGHCGVESIGDHGSAFWIEFPVGENH